MGTGQLLNSVGWRMLSWGLSHSLSRSSAFLLSPVFSFERLKTTTTEAPICSIFFYFGVLTFFFGHPQLLLTWSKLITTTTFTVCPLFWVASWSELALKKRARLIIFRRHHPLIHHHQIKWTKISSVDSVVLWEAVPAPVSMPPSSRPSRWPQRCWPPQRSALTRPSEVRVDYRLTVR